MAKAYRQYGAVPFRKEKGAIEVLLITSRRSKRWVVPKGWLKDTPRKTARVEAYEESGVRGKLARHALGAIEYSKSVGVGRAAKVRCRLEVFPLAVTSLKKDWPERRQRTRRWFPLSVASKKCSNPDLGRLILRFGRQMRSGVRATGSLRGHPSI